MTYFSHIESGKFADVRQAANIEDYRAQFSGVDTSTWSIFAVAPVPAFVVTGSVTFGVLIGSSDDAARRAVVPDLTAAFEGIAARRRLEITVEEGIDPDATRCDPGIVALFERAVAATGLPVARLAQGLSTNAFNMAVLGPIGLMLERCRGAVGWGRRGSWTLPISRPDWTC